MTRQFEAELLSHRYVDSTFSTLHSDAQDQGVPHHSDWIHEVKQDGFRLIVQRDGERVRLFTRNGYDWASRYPLIVEAARRIRTKQIVIDDAYYFLLGSS